MSNFQNDFIKNELLDLIDKRALLIKEWIELLGKKNIPVKRTNYLRDEVNRLSNEINRLFDILEKN